MYTPNLLFKPKLNNFIFSSQSVVIFDCLAAIYLKLNKKTVRAFWPSLTFYTGTSASDTNPPTNLSSTKIKNSYLSVDFIAYSYTICYNFMPRRCLSFFCKKILKLINLVFIKNIKF